MTIGDKTGLYTAGQPAPPGQSPEVNFYIVKGTANGNNEIISTYQQLTLNTGDVVTLYFAVPSAGGNPATSAVKLGKESQYDLYITVLKIYDTTGAIQFVTLLPFIINTP